MKLGVNIDHIATLRNARGGFEPSVLDAAVICERQGVSAITVHLREDRRHIRDNDVLELKKFLHTNINLEMAQTIEMQEFALKTLPYACCIVPEKRQELTTEGGLVVAGKVLEIAQFIKPLQEKGIVISLFIEPSEEQVKAAAQTGAEFVELHTGKYAEAFGGDLENSEFERLQNAAKLAQSLGLQVNAGHGLNYENVSNMKKIDGIVELNIGHSIVSRAVFVGLERAVKEMLGLI
ncbi:pyridoxine 5-phosphate synthase [Candidatus Gastranaerophilus sp. (ex Termes propinquus)]|nr:pyridoxine 5-phosphate synthase [Candidatus Gastranaerophilus sp. (ex Termes propinquus)]GBF23130.1 pyridoxine 5-phosphate synthase [Candidatus Gastranaerophilus sp. (ex Termes propinquus)]